MPCVSEVDELGCGSHMRKVVSEGKGQNGTGTDRHPIVKHSPWTVTTISNSSRAINNLPLPGQCGSATFDARSVV